MIVHFIGSKGNLTEEITSFRRIVDSIKKQGHTLAFDWVEDTFKLVERGIEEASESDWAKIDQENTAAISKADVVIVEATKKSFFVGYQVAQAVQQKKPTLILTQDNSFPGIKALSKSSDIVQGAVYNNDNFDKVVAAFIEENTVHNKDLRFNFFIDRQIYNYLRWASFKTSKTKAEILRELVLKEIDNKDGL